MQKTSSRVPKSKKEQAKEVVFYIASNDELQILNQTSTDEEVENFLSQFWAIRDPDLSTPENEFMDLYMERWQYASEHFRGHQPGWKTDLGRIHIVYGEPDGDFFGSTDDMRSDDQFGDFDETNLQRSTMVSNPNQSWKIWAYNYTNPLEVSENYTIFYFEKKATTWRLVWTNNIKEKGYHSSARLPIRAKQIINDYLQ